MGVAVAVGAGSSRSAPRPRRNYAGPSVTLAFVVAAVTCASRSCATPSSPTAVPVAGSAYTFTYATMGELLAWIIGWDLILEMLTAAAVIAKYWGIYLEQRVRARWGGLPAVDRRLRRRSCWGAVPDRRRLHHAARPRHEALRPRRQRLHADQDRRRALRHRRRRCSYVIRNYAPFVPPPQPPEARGGRHGPSPSSPSSPARPAQYGVFGLFAGASLVFFAFIGFDVVATSAEEVKNPQKTLPRGIFGGLGIVTVLYIWSPSRSPAWCRTRGSPKRRTRP